MAFELPELPYSHDALAKGGMSAETLEFHHDLHHKAYVDNGNKLISGTEWENKSLEEITIGTYNSTSVSQNGIFNNISQLWNHNQFWEMLKALVQLNHLNQILVPLVLVSLDLVGAG